MTFSNGVSSFSVSWLHAARQASRSSSDRFASAARFSVLRISGISIALNRHGFDIVSRFGMLNAQMKAGCVVQVRVLCLANL